MVAKKNWLELPDDITSEIVVQLREDFDDLVRFGAVCKAWQSLSVDVLKKYGFSPWLMLSDHRVNDDGDDSSTTTNHNKKEVRKFYCLSTKKVFHNYLPEALGKRCYGSPLGWLLTIDLHGNMNLLNPLNRCHIPLPSPLTFPCQRYTRLDPILLRMGLVTHFAMSSNNMSDGSCVVMVVYSHGCSVAFCRPGDQSWTAVSGPIREAQEDIIFFKGKFYTIGTQGMLRVCDFDSPNPKLIDILSTSEDDVCTTGQNYLVEMSGDLHLVVRYYSRDQNAPEGILHYVDKLFDVFKLDVEANKWIELFDLEEYAIFVGTHTSFSISTLDHPQLKPNSIYFTDDHLESYRDHIFEDSKDEEEYYANNDGGGGLAMGIFDFEQETIEPLYMGSDMFSTFSPPLLFTPYFK